MVTIFDTQFFDMPRLNMYKSWVFPELYPHEPEARLENWHADDLEAYCGIYTSKLRRTLRMPSPFKEAV